MKKRFTFSYKLAVWLTVVLLSVLGGPLAFAQQSPGMPEDTTTATASMRAICQGGTVQVWGANNFGQLGLGYNSPFVAQPTVIPNLTNVVDIAWSNGHTIALLADGTVRTWGHNTTQQLGLGATNTTDYNTPQVVNISCVKAVFVGTDYTMAIKEDGSLWSWGNNFEETLGVGGNIPVSGIPLLVPTNAPVAKVSCSRVHCVAIMADGSMKAWGVNGPGVFGSASGYATPQPVHMPPGVTVATSVVATESSSGFVTANGEVYMWGGGQYGQLGMGPQVGVVLNTPARTPLPPGTIATQIAMTSTTTLITTTTGLLVWGSNSNGLLGDAYCGNYAVQYNAVAGPPLAGVVDARAAGNSSFTVTLSSGQMRTWGSNRAGQLGYSTAPLTYSCVATSPNLTCPVVPPRALLPIAIKASHNGLCLGDRVTLTASGGGGSYQWSPSIDIVSSTATSITVSPSITTTYTVTGSCGTTASYRVVVDANCCLQNQVLISQDLTGTYNSFAFVPGEYYRIPDNTTVTFVSGTFELSGGTTLLMGQNAQLIIDDGAELQLKGGTITAACGYMWGSVEVTASARGILTDQDGTMRSRIMHSYDGVVLDDAKSPVPYFRLGYTDFRNNRQSVVLNRASNPADRDDYVTKCAFDSDPKQFQNPWQPQGSDYHYSLRHLAVNGDFLPATFYANTFANAYFGVHVFDGTQGPTYLLLDKNNFSDFWLGGVYGPADQTVAVGTLIDLRRNTFTFPASSKLPPTTQTDEVLSNYTNNRLTETFGGYMQYGGIRAFRNTFQQLDSTKYAQMADYDQFPDYRPRQTGLCASLLPSVNENRFYLLDRGVNALNVPLGPYTELQGNGFLNCHVGMRAHTLDDAPQQYPQHPELNANCNTFRRDAYRAGTSTGLFLDLPYANFGNNSFSFWPQLLVQDPRSDFTISPAVIYPSRNLFDDGGTNGSGGAGHFVAVDNNSQSYVLNYYVPTGYQSTYQSWSNPTWVKVQDALVSINSLPAGTPGSAQPGDRDAPCLTDKYPKGSGLQQRPAATPLTPGLGGPTLGQNVPNPCSGSTNILYRVPTGEANLIVRRVLDGSIVAQVPLSAGSTQHTLDLRGYAPGVYAYTLLVNGRPVQTKRLLIN